MSELQNIKQAGWDVGGAHLKLALFSENSLQVFQWPCPLWRGLQELIDCLNVAFAKISGDQWVHHLTMTGELVDIFDNREDGVIKIIDTFIKTVPSGHHVKIFSGNDLVSAGSAIANTRNVASANWLASGQLLSRYFSDALFIDMGSTTADLLLIQGGKPCNMGYTDAERLRTGELVYTGAVRTCVNTICNSIPYDQDMVPMMAENFAVSADVYRILEALPDHADSGETMDGQGKDKVASMRRLARMIGEDFREPDIPHWEKASLHISTQQKEMIMKQARIQLARLDKEGVIVAAGVGRFLIQQVAQEIAIPCYDFSDAVLSETVRYSDCAADCAPAVSLALY